MAKTISQAVYAKQRGVTPARISHLISKGVIITVDGKVDPIQADAAIEAAANPAYAKGPGRPAKDRGLSNYADAAAREKHFKALLAELDLKEREGELVNAAEVQHLLTMLITDCKTRLRAIPAKSASEVAHLKQAKTGRELRAAIQKLLLREIDEALVELSNWQPKGDAKK